MDCYVHGLENIMNFAFSSRELLNLLVFLCFVLLGCVNRQLVSTYSTNGTLLSQGSEVPRDLREGDK